jgi:hypothetical protein
MKKNVIIVICMICAFFYSCSPVSVNKPEGFAEKYTQSSYNAISPEGVLFRIREVKNYPEKEIGFWQKAVKAHLEKEGYKFVKEEEFTAGSTKGMLFEWGAPYGFENYIYMTGIAVFGRKIIIAEAAGEFSLYNQYRNALLTSLTSMKVQ